MTPQEFIAKWRPVTLSERSACHSHFNDLCLVLGQPQPVAADPEGAWYTFERGVTKTAGGHGWADVWMRGRFGWEYKKRRRDLAEAYQQLLQYREDLENPPLLVVCDMDRFEVHTNFTGTVKRVHAFNLERLADPQNLDVLRKVFTDPDALKPGQTTEAITEQASERFGQLADGLRVRSVPAHDAAHFLMKLMFCMFAEDIGLLKGKVFTHILDNVTEQKIGGLPLSTAGAELSRFLQQLFSAMSIGGYFGATKILHFNGGLFADNATSRESRPSPL
ncbi:MAG: type IIL restriction-modification enzyme MmeI, partial [Planctomycetaceae bacterium]